MVDTSEIVALETARLWSSLVVGDLVGSLLALVLCSSWSYFEVDSSAESTLMRCDGLLIALLKGSPAAFKASATSSLWSRWARVIKHENFCF